MSDIYYELVLRYTDDSTIKAQIIFDTLRELEMYAHNKGIRTCTKCGQKLGIDISGCNDSIKQEVK